MKVQYKDKEIEIEKPERVIDVLKEECTSNTIACICNNEIKSLNHEIKMDSKIELLDISNADGMRIYIRGLLYIMSKAFEELYPQAEVGVEYQLSNSMFCTIKNMDITDELLEKVHKKMQEIVDKNIPIIKKQFTKQEAEEIYKNVDTVKGRLQLENKSKKKFSLYYCEDYFNYFYGVMPISTEYMKIFEIQKYSNGFLIRYPSKKDITKVPEFIDNKKLLQALADYEKIHKVLNIETLTKLNKAIRDGKAKDIVMLDEALHEKKISRIADSIAEKKDVKMVLIAGPSSSGKTTFAQRLGLQLQLNGLKPVTISVDNYFVEREQTPVDSDGKYDFEAIEAVDMKLLNEHIERLLNGEEVEMPTFNFTTGSKEYKGNKIKLGKDDIIVMEGIHCLNDRLTAQIPRNKKFKVYISALTVLNIDEFNRISTTDSRLIRRIVRDSNFRSYSAIHTLKMWDSVNRGELKNIFPFQEEADAMFNTSLIYEICVLKKYALPQLEAIDNRSIEFSEAKRIREFLKYFEDIPDDLVPTNSLLREFIGGGDFKY